MRDERETDKEVDELIIDLVWNLCSITFERNGGLYRGEDAVQFQGREVDRNYLTCMRMTFCFMLNKK